MKIIETTLFTKQRDMIVFYIADDKKSAALEFAKQLKTSVNTLKKFPYKCRKSIYYEDKTIRDMTFKGYSVIYRVLESQNSIEILEIFNKNLPTINSEKEI